MSTQAPANLPDLVKAAFNKARAGGHLVFYPTQAMVLSLRSGSKFQLRYAPALAQKPDNPASSTVTRASAVLANPFAIPEPELLVSPIPPSHFLVLNKFAVVPEHFILATYDFVPQIHLLAAEDLAAAYACIEAYANNGRELFAFYNSGEHSGASQPHRHLQFLPVDRMREGLTREEDEAWKLLADAFPVGDSCSNEAKGMGVPFRTFTERLYLGIDADELHRIYLRLYREAVCAVRGEPEVVRLNPNSIPDTGETRISYNLAMTATSMVLCPRFATHVPVMVKGTYLGNVGLNGTVLSGSILVKSEVEWDAMRQNPDMLEEILRQIGMAHEEVS